MAADLRDSVSLWILFCKSMGSQCSTALFFCANWLVRQSIAKRQKLFFIIQLTIEEQNWEIINVYHSIWYKLLNPSSPLWAKISFILIKSRYNITQLFSAVNNRSSCNLNVFFFAANVGLCDNIQYLQTSLYRAVIKSERFLVTWWHCWQKSET